jgi:succinoglycan biosynthesis protein ExoV
VRLIYYKPPQKNFGDDLNAVLWPKLAPELFERDSDEGFLGIGTIIGMPTPEVDFLNVFSSGVGYDPLDNWTIGRRVWCVRGPLSARALNLEPRAALTDGGVLAPELLRDVHPVKRHGVAVLPHWESLNMPGWDEACRLAGFDLIDPRQSPIAVIDRIRRHELILTSSLHGAIVADALEVPWIMFASCGNFSPFKCYDWCASMAVPLTPVVITPPSARPWVRYGRTGLGGAGDRPVLDADFAWTEFKTRMRRRAARTDAGVGMGGRLKKAALKAGLLEPLLGLSAEQTADNLTRAARMTPVLSSESRRRTLAAEMHERLDTLRRRARPRPCVSLVAGAGFSERADPREAPAAPL